LSLSDTKKAIQKLLLSNNLEYAFSLAQMFYSKAIDQISILLFMKALEAGAFSIASKLVEGIKDDKIRKLLEVV